jgi:dihydroflavonol-4-reductase
MAKIFITGATGFIGSHLVEALVAQDHEVRCLIRPTSQLQWLPRDRVKFFPLNTSAAEDFADVLRGVDTVYHLAGATKARSLADYQKHNVNLTRQLLEAIKRYAPHLRRLIMMSSQAAAGPAAPGETPDENVVCRPVTHYGESKLAAERLLALYPRIPSVVLRPVSVYGPRDRDVLTLVNCVLHRFAPVIGSRDRRLTFVYVADLVSALLLAAESPQAVGQTYFVTDGGVYTWRETQAVIEKILQRRALAVPVPAPLVWTLAWLSETWSRVTRRPTIFNMNKVKELMEQNWGCSSEKIRKDLGFAPRYPLEAGLRLTVAWARQAKWL